MEDNNGDVFEMGTTSWGEENNEKERTILFISKKEL